MDSEVFLLVGFKLEDGAIHNIDICAYNMLAPFEYSLI